MVVYYNKSVQVNEQEMNESNLRTLHQAAVNISYYVNNAARASDSFFAKPRLHEYLKLHKDYEAYQHLQDFIHLVDYINSFSEYPDIARIRIFIDPQLPFSNENIHFFSLNRLQHQPWYDEVVRKNGDILWKSAYPQTTADTLTTDVITAARIIRDPLDYDNIVGVLMVDLNQQTLQDSISHLQDDMGGTTYVLNEEGAIIGDKDLRRLGQQRMDKEFKEETAGKNEGFFKKEINNQDYYVQFAKITGTGWTIVSEVPVSGINAESRNLTRTSAIIVMAATFIVFLLLIVLSLGLIAESISRRVKDLIRIIRRDGVERLNDRIRFGFRDFRLLEQNILELVQTTNTMAEETYRSRIQEREAQLKALQAQINPHFLYNTLETINWMAIRSGSKDISAMIKALTTYFRLTLNKGKDFVSIRDEVKLSVAYLDIQRSRFENAFEFQLEVEEGAEAMLIPKLTLQPIIENALMHGIRKRRDPSPGWIKLAIRHGSDGDLFITIADNGPGIPSDVQWRLMPTPQPSGDEEAGGYGLFNVHERIRLYCGEPYGLSVQSELGEGTAITLHMKGRQIN
ncbi:cache domain-containing sensor histidine kinase [Paenibacillus swuensis]|nr:sensor histidine kinase [Paenibacillus swuensis]